MKATSFSEMLVITYRTHGVTTQKSTLWSFAAMKTSEIVHFSLNVYFKKCSIPFIANENNYTELLGFRTLSIVRILNN
jgi:hypothetical protein